MTSRPIVRYHGGKWLLAPWIVSTFPKHRVYVEPFGGAASVLLRKPRSFAEVYNDLDGEIVNVFRMARERGEELRALLELTPFARVEFELSYEACDDELERARRTIFRGCAGFGSAAACGETSGFRARSDRSGTAPARDWRNYPQAFVETIERLRGVVIESRDAKEVMVYHDAETTLHYCDPPYVHSTRSSKTRGTPNRKSYKFEMTDAEHRALAEFLNTLRGFVVVSGYRCDLYDEIFDGWVRMDRAAHADGARDRVECLWFNRSASYNIPAQQLFGMSA